MNKSVPTCMNKSANNTVEVSSYLFTLNALFHTTKLIRTGLAKTVIGQQLWSHVENLTNRKLANIVPANQIPNKRR